MCPVTIQGTSTVTLGVLKIQSDHIQDKALAEHEYAGICVWLRTNPSHLKALVRVIKPLNAVLHQTVK